MTHKTNYLIINGWIYKFKIIYDNNDVDIEDILDKELVCMNVENLINSNCCLNIIVDFE